MEMAAEPVIVNNKSGSNNEESGFIIKANEFIQKNRRALFIGIICLAVILTAFIITLTVRENLRERAFTRVDELQGRHDALRYLETSGENLDSSFSAEAEMSYLLNDLIAFAGKNSGYAAARAYSTIASIYEEVNNWVEAENSWISAAKAASKTYMAPIALYNAAVAAEEQGKIDTALELYSEAAAYGNAFPGSARAQFSIGRLHESRNSNTAALDAYRTLLARWPSDPMWANLAQSRIIVLSQ